MRDAGALNAHVGSLTAGRPLGLRAAADRARPVTLFVVSLVIFAATQALPGDAARAILGRNATPESLATLRHQLHLDRPVTEQYTHWLRGIFTGDLGQSLAANEPVTKLIGKPIENSAFLMLLAAVVSIPLSIALGSVAARRRDRPFDHITSIVLLALAALPEFVVAIALVVLFGTTVTQLLPAVSLVPPGDAPWQHLKELVLPTLTLVIAVSPYVARIMRASMVEVLESDYVEMARLKGLPERVVLWRHAVPNGIAPTIQVIALNLAYLAGGIVVVEYVFDYPGIGTAPRRRGRQPRHARRPGAGDADRRRLRRSEPARRHRHDPGQPAPADVDMSEVAVTAATCRRRPPAARPLLLLVRRAWRLSRTRVGVALVVFLVGVALVGPLFAPHSPTEFAGAPVRGAVARPVARHRQPRPRRPQPVPLGRPLDPRALGRGDGDRARARRRDRARRRVLALHPRRHADADDGRHPRVPVDRARTRRRLDRRPEAVAARARRGGDDAPRVARVTRGAALEIVGARLCPGGRGDGRVTSQDPLRRAPAEHHGPLMVEASLRLTYAIGLIAALSFLGFGLQPPAADWGLMINENRQGLTVQPWGVVVPVIAIALLTIGTSLIGDGLARAAIGIDRGDR